MYFLALTFAGKGLLRIRDCVCVGAALGGGAGAALGPLIEEKRGVFFHYLVERLSGVFDDPHPLGLASLALGLLLLAGVVLKVVVRVRVLVVAVVVVEHLVLVEAPLGLEENKKKRLT